MAAMAAQNYPMLSNSNSNNDFFVEVDPAYDLSGTEYDLSEYTRRMARERQLALAGTLNQQVCDVYMWDILDHLQHMEVVTLPDAAAIDLQTEIRWHMRKFLLDFLVEAHALYKLRPQTLFLAVNLVDRYCSIRVVFKRHFQLLGCAALLVAAKFSDRKERVPTLRELQHLCCSAYDREMFLQIEWHLLQTLGWVIGHPTVDTFLMVATADVPYDAEVEHMATYILETAMYHRQYVSVLPSQMARAALSLAVTILGRSYRFGSKWAAECDPELVMNLSYHLQDPSQIVARKYTSSKYSSVAGTADTFLRKHFAYSTGSDTPMSYGPAVRLEGFPRTPVNGLPSLPMGVPSPPITPEQASQPSWAPRPPDFRNLPSANTYTDGYKPEMY